MYFINAFKVETGELVNSITAQTGRDLESYAFSAADHHEAATHPDEHIVTYSADGKYRYELINASTNRNPAAFAPQRGDTVRVFKGRKVAKGTVGVVRWTGVDNYGNDRVGLAVEGEPKLVYTAADNVELVEAAPKAPAYDGPRYAKGDTVTLNGAKGKVFWSGPAKGNPSRLRVGVKLANGESVFVDAGELGEGQTPPPAPAPEPPRTELIAKHEPQRLTNYGREDLVSGLLANIKVHGR